jgi:hypothetical protein
MCVNVKSDGQSALIVLLKYKLQTILLSDKFVLYFESELFKSIQLPDIRFAATPVWTGRKLTPYTLL